MAALTIGDPAPWFTLPSTSNPQYHFNTVGGYRVILFFFGSRQFGQAAQAIQDFCAMQAELKAANIPFFGVSVDPADQGLASQIISPTYCKFLWDFEQQVSQQYGVCEPAGQYQPTTFVLSENLSVQQVFPLQQAEGYAAQVFDSVTSLPPSEPPCPAARQAPVLFIPQVLEPELCQEIIQLHQSTGGRSSGFMREVDGKTVEILDPEFKKRRDINLADTPLLEAVNQRIIRRIKPEIAKAFQFEISRFERHLVACYDATDQGFFNRHRDNTTKGTAHRRFAMTLNLNPTEYEGGDLRFPEYGNQLYRTRQGEAVIFSSSLLHEVTPVTHGQRYALLSFFYGDEDALLRAHNQQFLASHANQAKSSEAKPKQAGFGSSVKPASAKAKKRR